MIDVSPGTPYILEGKKETIPLKIALTGFEKVSSEKRTPVNVALVLDRSGSMRGEKIEQAKRAAIQALQLLSPEDIVSVVTYDDSVKIVIPATKLRNKQEVIDAISKISIGGSTALFAGVSRGAKELEKFIKENQVNRVILLSDGIANVGPSSPMELGELGNSLARDGISVSTIGLGLRYNEDLMTKLADRSDGNHFFVEQADDLASIFKNEFGDILNVVAQDIKIQVVCPRGIRPVRVIGRDADIHGDTVFTSVGQLYSNEEKYVILEVEVPAGSAGTKLELAKVKVSYNNLDTKTLDNISGKATVEYTDSDKIARTKVDKKALSDYYKQLANTRNEEAIRLRDAGKKEAAQKVLQENSSFLGKSAQRYDIPELEKEADSYGKEAQKLDTESWQSQRKSLRAQEYKFRKKGVK